MMSKDKTDYSKDDVDLAFQLLRAHKERIKLIGDEEAGLKKVNDLTKKIAHSTELMVKLKKSGENLSNQITESKVALELSRKTLASHIDTLDATKLAARLAAEGVSVNKNKLDQAIKSNAFDLDEVELLERQLSASEQILMLRKKDISMSEMNIGLFSAIVKGSEDKLRIDESILKKNEKNVNTLNKHIAARKEELRWAEKINKENDKIKKVVETITSPFLLLAGFLTLGWKRFVELDSAAADFRKTTGLAKSQTVELTKEIENMSLEYGAFGIGVKEGYAAVGALVDQFGSMNKSVRDNKDTVALLSANLGVANDVAAGFVAYMDQVGGMSKEQTQNMAGFAKNLSDASGVPLPKIMEDVAKASDHAKSMTGGSVINLIKASAQARKFGVDLNKVTESARGMLNFNESINDELEASVLLGKNLSFMDARRAAYAGDLAAAQRATLKEVERMGDFNKLDVLQQEALAKASGYSVSDLQKMIKLKKLYNNATDVERSKYDALMKAKEDAAKNDGSLGDKVKEMEMQGTMDTLNNSLGTLKNSLAQLLIPILKALTPLVNGLAIVANWVGEVTVGLGGITQGILGAGAAAVLLYISFGGISKLLSGMIGLSSKLTSGIGKAISNTKIGKGIGGLLGKTVGKSVESASTVAESVKPSAGAGFSTFMKNFSDGIKSFSSAGKKVFTDIISGIVTGLKNLLDLIPKAAGALSNSFSTLAKGLSNGFTSLSVAIKNIIVNIMSGISTGIKSLLDILPKLGKSIGEAFNNLSSGLSGGLRTLSTMLKDVFVNIMSGISEGVKKILDILPKFGKALGDGVSSLVNGLSRGLSTLSVTLKNILVNIVSGIVDSAKKLLDIVPSLGKALGEGFNNLSVGLSKGLTNLSVMIRDVFGNIVTTVVNGANKLLSLIPKLGESLGKGFSSLMQGVAKGLSYLADPKAMAGVLALVGMSAALAIAAYGFKMFSEVSWGDLAKAGVAIIGLTAAVLGLGLLMGTGVGAAAIVLGAAALAIMGAALLPFGAAALMAGAGMNMLGDGLSKIVPQLSELAKMSAGLLGASVAIYALSAAFAAFGAGQAAAGLGSFVGNLFGGDRIKEFQKLADLGPQLQVTANAIKSINNPSTDNSATTETNKTSQNQQNSVTKTTSTSNDAIVSKLDELIGLMKSGGIAVNLDGRRVSSGLASAVS